eukprot:g10464.t1
MMAGGFCWVSESERYAFEKPTNEVPKAVDKCSIGILEAGAVAVAGVEFEELAKRSYTIFHVDNTGSAFALLKNSSKDLRTGCIAHSFQLHTQRPSARFYKTWTASRRILKKRGHTIRHSGAQFHSNAEKSQGPETGSPATPKVLSAVDADQSRLVSNDGGKTFASVPPDHGQPPYAEERRMLASGDPATPSSAVPLIEDEAYKTPLPAEVPDDISPINGDPGPDVSMAISSEQGSTFQNSAKSVAVNVSTVPSPAELDKSGSSLCEKMHSEDEGENWPARMIGDGSSLLPSEDLSHEKHSFAYEVDHDHSAVPKCTPERSTIFAKRLLRKSEVLNCSQSVASLQMWLSAAWTGEVEQRNIETLTPFPCQVKDFEAMAKDFGTLATIPRPGLRKKTDLMKAAMNLLGFIKVGHSPSITLGDIQHKPRNYVWRGLMPRVLDGGKMALVDHLGAVHTEPTLGQGTTTNWPQEKPTSPIFGDASARISGSCGGGRYVAACDAFTHNRSTNSSSSPKAKLIEKERSRKEVQTLAGSWQAQPGTAAGRCTAMGSGTTGGGKASSKSWRGLFRKCYNEIREQVATGWEPLQKAQIEREQGKPLREAFPAGAGKGWEMGPKSLPGGQLSTWLTTRLSIRLTLSTRLLAASRRPQKWPKVGTLASWIR